MPGRIVTHPPPAKPTADGSMPGGWWHESEIEGRVVCDLCPRECHLAEGDRGFCFVREMRDGQMQLTTYGRSTGFCIDPIEKKPLNHFYPGTSVLSFGTAGCNLGCKFCQNWDISKSREVRKLSAEATPETIAEAASELGCQSVAFTYNDPVIWAEYAIDTARACRERGIQTVAVTAGYISPPARASFFEYMDAANVDLKAFSEQFYHKVTLSHLEPVLETLQWLAKESDTWVEITNLLIPDENDSDEELQRLIHWVLENMGDDVPLHFSAFHPDYRMNDKPRTPHDTLLRAHSLARQNGVRHAYVGNVHDEQHQSTYCPSCNQLLIERDWYQLGTYQMQGNQCGNCGETIAGRFADQPGNWGRKRQPVQIRDYARPSTSVPGDDVMTSENNPQPASQPSSQFQPLGQQQQRLLHKAACQVVADAVAGQATVDLATLLGDAAADTVMGCFVTLKKRGQLRACCGVLNRPFRVDEALQQAAVSTATRDRRFPPISASELPGLHLDVSLLHNFQAIDVPTASRPGVIQVGHHGLVIRQGTQSGLLLPVVAVDYGWDAEQFLRRVCHKAGLPEDAWQRDDTELQTFEVQVVEAAWNPEIEATADSAAILQPAELRALAEHSLHNVLALMAGATANCYLSSCPDMMLNGIALELSDPDIAGTIQTGRLSSLSTFPLQSSLFQLAEGLAQALVKQNVGQSVVKRMQPHLLLLDDPVPHGPLASAELSQFDCQRAMVISDGQQSVWRADPGQAAETRVDTMSELAGILDPQDWQLVSYRAAASRSSFQFSALRRNAPAQETAVRPTAVAGRFYPADAEELSAMVEQMTANPPAEKAVAQAVMVPHAGLVYSGQLAADVLQAIEIPETVIILCPKHTPHGKRWAVDPHHNWSLPGGQLAGDLELAEQLVAGIDGLELDRDAHRDEHGIEVELPLLSHLAPGVRVVGIVVGQSSLEECQEFGRQLAAVLDDLESRPLLIISSDMNHFADDTHTRKVDAMALAAMETLDPAQLYKVVQDNQVSMCGICPAVVVMQCLATQDRLAHCRQIGYTTSGEVSGDTSRVVGYAGVVLTG